MKREKKIDTILLLGPTVAVVLLMGVLTWVMRNEQTPEPNHKDDVGAKSEPSSLSAAKSADEPAFAQSEVERVQPAQPVAPVNKVGDEPKKAELVKDKMAMAAEKSESSSSVGSSKSTSSGGGGGGSVMGWSVGKNTSADGRNQNLASEYTKEELDKLGWGDKYNFDRVGTTQGVPPSRNEQVRQLFYDIKAGRADSVSPILKGPKFQADEFANNYNYEKQYLNKIEPSRVFAPAQPGKNVPVISRISKSYISALQGEEVELKVAVPAGSPVTFSSFDLGAFENDLVSITVKADKKGIARTKFKGTPGTISEVKILAASPIASGQVKFIVDVIVPTPKNEVTLQ